MNSKISAGAIPTTTLLLPSTALLPNSRFLVNLPAERLQDNVRLCFEVEQMWWFYIDLCCMEVRQG